MMYFIAAYTRSALQHGGFGPEGRKEGNMDVGQLGKDKTKKKNIWCFISSFRSFSKLSPTLNGLIKCGILLLLQDGQLK